MDLDGRPSCSRRGRAGPLLRLWALLFVVAAIGFAAPAGADVARPVYQRVLSNGLRVVICPDPQGTDVSVFVRYDVGARDEPSGLEGLAHLTEHLMFTGTKHIPAGQVLKVLSDVGATNINGETTLDASTFHETMPPEQLEFALWLESDRMGYLLDRLDAAAVAQERAAVLNEFRDRVTDRPFGVLGAVAYAELFPKWHPYQHLTQGNVEAIQRLSLADARAFVTTWYGPGNAVLTIAGRVDPVMAAAAVERWFGTLPARPPPRRPALPAASLSRSTFVRVDASVTRPRLDVHWVTPALDAPGDAELDVAAAVLSNRGAGWLERALVSPGIAVSVGAGQQSMQHASVFTVHVVLADGHRPDEALARVDHALSRFQSDVGQSDLQRARMGWYNAKLFALESSMAWASRLAAARLKGPLAAVYDGDVDQHSHVSPDAVRGAVRSWLGPAKRVVVAGLPVRGTPVAGRVVERTERTP